MSGRFCFIVPSRKCLMFRGEVKAGVDSTSPSRAISAEKNGSSVHLEYGHKMLHVYSPREVTFNGHTND
jgi:hypothetical protein